MQICFKCAFSLKKIHLCHCRYHLKNYDILNVIQTVYAISFSNSKITFPMLVQVKELQKAFCYNQNLSMLC